MCAHNDPTSKQRKSSSIPYEPNRTDRIKYGWDVLSANSEQPPPSGGDDCALSGFPDPIVLLPPQPHMVLLWWAPPREDHRPQPTTTSEASRTPRARSRPQPLPSDGGGGGAALAMLAWPDQQGKSVGAVTKTHRGVYVWWFRVWHCFSRVCRNCVPGCVRGGASARSGPTRITRYSPVRLGYSARFRLFSEKDFATTTTCVSWRIATGARGPKCWTAAAEFACIKCNWRRFARIAIRPGGWRPTTYCDN